jgi:hypothetical protein
VVVGVGAVIALYAVYIAAAVGITVFLAILLFRLVTQGHI